MPSQKPASLVRVARRLRSLAPALLAAFWVLSLIGADAAAQQAGAADGLGGAYRGIDEAEGWQITLSARPEGGFDGLMVDRGGASYLFEAVGDASVAEARVELLGVPVFMRFSPRPVGLMSFWIPIDENGALKIEEAQPYAFVRSDIELPEMPTGLAPPPEELGTYMEPLAFLRSYEFWNPQEVGRGYANLTDRYRALIRLYAHVHTDILWKLCQSRATPPGLSEALQGQNMACDQVLQSIADAQRRGTFAQYKKDLTAQKAVLNDAVRCTRGGLMEEQCVTISKFTSQAAISLATAQTVLSRY